VTPRRYCHSLAFVVVWLCLAGQAYGQAIVVTNTNDSGPGSFRQAILTANSQGGADTIVFDIPGTGPFVITPLSTLPAFDDGAGVTIDATSQPGYATQPLVGTGGTVGTSATPLERIRTPIVQIFGNGLAGNGLTFGGGNNSTVRGLHVWGFSGTNVSMSDSNSATFALNVIGGTPAFGDPGPALRAAINLLLDRGENPSFFSNLIGYASTADNIVTTGQRAGFTFTGNELVGSLLISASEFDEIEAPRAIRTVAGNLIRVSAGYGIDVVGGPSGMAFSENTIRDNGLAGIRLTNLGTKATKNNVVERNIVSGNAGAGVLVTGDPGGANVGNRITTNEIFGNAGIGIDLGGEISDQRTGDGSTPNDDGDGDQGGNQLFNFAVIESATLSGGRLIVTGWSPPAASIEFFANLTSAREGRAFVAVRSEGGPDDLDSTTSTYGPDPVNGVFQGTETTTRFRFEIPVSSVAAAGLFLTATATAPVDPTNTSEFGGPVSITAGGADVSVVKAGPPGATPGSTVTYTITVRNDGADAATGVTVQDPTPAGLLFSTNAGACTTPFPCVLGTIPSAQSRSITTTYSVPSGYVSPNPIVNQATATTTAPDANPANNTAVVTTPITPRADVAIAKGGPATVTPGGLLTYTITLRNDGPSDATGVVVADVLPPGLTFVSNAGDCSTPFPCAVGTVPVDAVRSIVTTLAVPAGYSLPNPIVNTATVTATTPDPAPANNAATVTTAVGAARADLAIVKASPRTAARNVNLQYTLVVRNAGPSNATDVVVDDPTPPGLAFVGSAGDCTTAFPCALGTVAPGETRTITVTFTVPSAYAGPDPIVNTATVMATSLDPDPANNTASISTPIRTLGNRNVEIAKAGPATIRAGSSLTYLITVTNGGVFDVNGVIVQDETPPGLTFVSTAGACTTAFPCALGTLPPGAVRQIVSTYLVPAGYTPPVIVNTAAVTSTPADDDPTDDIATAMTDVLAPLSDLQIAKTGPRTIVPGTSHGYAIVVMNNGPGSAPGVVVADPTPPGLTFVSTSGACVTAFPCSLGTLANGESRTITATFAVPPDYIGPAPIVNTATVGSAAVELDASNNAATTSTDVVPVADLAITKSGPVAVWAGSALYYTIGVTNRGPSAATGVVVADPTPSGLTFVATEGDCQTAFPCSLGTLAVGESRTIRATFTVPPDYVAPNPIVNRAVVTSTTARRGRMTNEAIALTAVIGRTDVALEKTVDVPSPSVGQVVTFTVSAFNHGPSLATGVQVVDQLPPGLTLVAAAPSQGSYDPTTGVWQIGTVPIGSAVTMPMEARVEVPGALVNKAEMMAIDQADQNASNDFAGVAVNETPTEADVAVRVSADSPAAPVGSQVTLTVVARNNGPGDATSVLMLLRLPSGVVPEATSLSAGAFDALTFRWTIPLLRAREEATLDFRVTILDNGSFVVVALKQAQTELDPQPGNNVGSVVLNGLAANLRIVKTVDKQFATVGEPLRFTIHAINDGPDGATGVVVRDEMPSSVAFVSATASQGAYDPGTGLWSVGSLAAAGPDRHATLEIDAIVVATGAIVNTARIESVVETDPPEGNTDATVSVASNELDLAANLSLIGAPGQVGTMVTLFAGIDNVSSATSTGRLTFSLVWPPELEHFSGPDDWTCTSARTTLSCFRDDLRVAPAAQVAPKVYLRVVGQLAQPAWVYLAIANQADVNSANNLSSLRVDSTLVIDPADLSVSQAVKPETGFVNQALELVVHLENHGPDAGHHVTTLHAIPHGLTVIDTAADGGACSGAPVVTCALGTVAAAEGRNIRLRLRADAPGVYSLASTATAIENDTSLANNQAQTRLVVSGTGHTGSTVPFGALDLPAEGEAVSGSIAVGGWAIGNAGVAHVRVFRDAVSGEPPGLVFIGEAVRVRGARPDVEALFLGAPEADRAGFGLLVLTNMLPGRGNGTFRLHAYAEDNQGRQALLGSRTIVAQNATAIAPFGTIDAPGQGEAIRGQAYPIFGWALTPQPKQIPRDGSTIAVYIDGRLVGPVVYNQYRSDVAALFSEMRNADGAVGYRWLDTTTLADGIHTMAWSVTDDAGVTQGLGSRFFWVNNGTASRATVGGTTTPRRSNLRTADAIPIVLAREMERIEIAVAALTHDACAPMRYDGREQVGEASRALPAGSTLDSVTGLFTWQPGPGFVGRYRLVFLVRGCDGATTRLPIDVVVHR
jgi:uncharacterized repeat protein (TIGR01451 family)